MNSFFELQRCIKRQGRFWGVIFGELEIPIVLPRFQGEQESRLGRGMLI